jgi:hypothetical protein
VTLRAIAACRRCVRTRRVSLKFASVSKKKVKKSWHELKAQLLFAESRLFYRARCLLAKSTPRRRRTPTSRCFRAWNAAQGCLQSRHRRSEAVLPALNKRGGKRDQREYSEMSSWPENSRKGRRSSHAGVQVCLLSPPPRIQSSCVFLAFRTRSIQWLALSTLPGLIAALLAFV